ncbi:hypothetical protein ACFL08_04595, partial [Patescibacteria group bacterium]
MIESEFEKEGVINESSFSLELDDGCTIRVEKEKEGIRVVIGGCFSGVQTAEYRLLKKYPD